MGAPQKYLFICTGNICRSITAELMLNDAAQGAGLDIIAKSCGIAAETYYGVPDEIWKALEKDFIFPRTHKPQLITRELLAWADVALAMTREHLEVAIEMFPDHQHKLKLFNEYAGLGDVDVADPMGQEQEAYNDARDRIRVAIDNLIKRR